MISFQEAIEPYREPTTRAIGLRKNPPDFSEDNLPLFYVTYLNILKYTLQSEDGCPAQGADYQLIMQERTIYYGILETLEMEPGCYSRRPLDSESSSYDDHLAIACFNSNLARSIYDYAIKHDWMWPPGKYLGRFQLFVPTVKYCAGVKLSMVSQLQLAGAFIWNSFEKKEETSGKCLHYMVSLAMSGSPSWIIQTALSIWRLRMTKLYGGPRGLYSIYFGSEHPFSIYSPEVF